MSTDLCIVSMMKLLKFWFYLLSGTTRNSKSVKKYYTTAFRTTLIGKFNYTIYIIMGTCDK